MSSNKLPNHSGKGPNIPKIRSVWLEMIPRSMEYYKIVAYFKKFGAVATFLKTERNLEVNYDSGVLKMKEVKACQEIINLAFSIFKFTRIQIGQSASKADIQHIKKERKRRTVKARKIYPKLGYEQIKTLFGVFGEVEEILIPSRKKKKSHKNFNKRHSPQHSNNFCFGLITFRTVNGARTAAQKKIIPILGSNHFLIIETDYEQYNNEKNIKNSEKQNHNMRSNLKKDFVGNDSSWNMSGRHPKTLDLDRSDLKTNMRHSKKTRNVRQDHHNNNKKATKYHAATYIESTPDQHPLESKKEQPKVPWSHFLRGNIRCHLLSQETGHYRKAKDKRELNLNSPNEFLHFQKKHEQIQINNSGASPLSEFRQQYLSSDWKQSNVAQRCHNPELRMPTETCSTLKCGGLLSMRDVLRQLNHHSRNLKFNFHNEIVGDDEQSVQGKRRREQETFY